MIQRHTYGDVEWIDLESPSREEVADIMREFDIDARIEDEIQTPTNYTLFIPASDYLFTVLHFPAVDAETGAKNQEIDFIVSKSFIITCRYEVIDSIHNLHKVFEAETLLGRTMSGMKTPVLLERLMRRLYGSLGREAETIASRLDRIERNIFAGREREMVRALSEVSRTLLRFETSLTRHNEALEAFMSELATPAFFGKGFSKHAAHIMAERDHAANLIGSYRAVTHELRDTNDSLLSTAQNQVMKTLTIMAFVTFPLSFIASLFGMNTENTPFVGTAHDFWIVFGIMVIGAVLAFLFFRIKRWL